jgi:hypothetical protein
MIEKVRSTAIGQSSLFWGIKMQRSAAYNGRAKQRQG